MPSRTPAAPRPLRRDAQRNREALLAAARAVLAERGLNAPLEAVAQRAGVAIGTLYRHFPTRAALVDAIVAEKLDAWAELGRRASAVADPWEAFKGFLEDVCELQAHDRTFDEIACGTPLDDTDATTAVRREILESTLRVIERAKEAGALRADFTLDDLTCLVVANSAVAEATRASGPAQRLRHLALMLDALRARAD